MGRAPSHKSNRSKPKVSDKKIVCQRQFPDCPAMPNDEFCSACPLYK